MLRLGDQVMLLPMSSGLGLIVNEGAVSCTLPSLMLWLPLPPSEMLPQPNRWVKLAWLPVCALEHRASLDRRATNHRLVAYWRELLSGVVVVDVRLRRPPLGREVG